MVGTLAGNKPTFPISTENVASPSTIPRTSFVEDQPRIQVITQKPAFIEPRTGADLSHGALRRDVGRFANSLRLYLGSQACTNTEWLNKWLHSVSRRPPPSTEWHPIPHHCARHMDCWLNRLSSNLVDASDLRSWVFDTLVTGPLQIQLSNLPSWLTS